MAIYGWNRIFVVLAFLVTNVVSQDLGLDYVGRGPCPSNSSVIGYTNTTLLNEDIIVDMNHVYTGGEPPDYFLYTLCPDTTFNIFETDPMTGEIISEGDWPIIPGLANSIFACGDTGLSAENCIFEGGDFHFYFPDFVIADQVYLAGITFKRAKLTSIYGDAHPRSHVVFLDCEWKFNTGQATMYIHYTDDDVRRLEEGKPYDLNMMMEKMQEDSYALANVNSVGDLLPEKNLKSGRDLQFDVKYSMSCAIVSCKFEKNIDNLGTIFNVGGSIELINSMLVDNNVAELAVLSVVNNGHAFIHELTSFSDNFAPFGPVYISSSSFLQLSRDNSGSENIGGECDAIFIEAEDSVCLDLESPCFGKCCEFGDESCDLYVETDSTPNTAPNPAPTSPSSPSRPMVSESTTSMATKEEGKCEGFCIAFVGVVAAIGGMLVFFGVYRFSTRAKRRERRDQAAIADSLRTMPSVQALEVTAAIDKEIE